MTDKFKTHEDINAFMYFSRKRDATPNNNKPVYVIPKDGVYLLIVYVGSPDVLTHIFSARCVYCQLSW